MARVNLSVPDQLKSDMDGFDLNWSAIAQEAFSNQIAIQRLKERNMHTEAGIERLRASKVSNTERTRAEGSRLGKEWALQHATYDELQRVAELSKSIGALRDVGVSTLLARAINEDGRESAVLGCVFGNMSQGELTDDLIEGFIEGATEVFALV